MIELAHKEDHGLRAPLVALGPLDLLGVLLLPLLCFIVDLWIGGLVLATYPGTVWTFACVGMCLFAVSLAGRASAAVGAALTVTAVGAGLIGLVLMPLSFLALPFSGLGLLGFVPFLTSDRFWRRGREIRAEARPGATAWLAGAALVVIPTAVVLLAETAGDERRKQDLRSRDPDRVVMALSRTAWYGPRDVVSHEPALRMLACVHLQSLPREDAKVEDALRHLFGITRQASDIETECDALLND